jgi:ATP-dependent DNA ligase
VLDGTAPRLVLGFDPPNFPPVAPSHDGGEFTHHQAVVRVSRSAGRLWNTRRLSFSGMPPPGFIEPCLPSPADRPPGGPDWIHEIKQDGYRLMARRDPVGIRLLTRNGYDWAPRYPLIVEAVNQLKVRSCLIDGEAVACDETGLAVFERLRRKHEGKKVFLFAFDLLELNGTDLRREPIEPAHLEFPSDAWLAWMAAAMHRWEQRAR